MTFAGAKTMLWAGRPVMLFVPNDNIENKED